MQGKFTVQCARPECGISTTVTIDSGNSSVGPNDVMLVLTQSSFAQDQGIKLISSGEINGKCTDGSVHPVALALITPIDPEHNLR